MSLDTYSYPSRRSAVLAAGGMVATSQPLAAQAGLAVLRSGGNALDAALAAAITLTVVEPTSNGIGSDVFAIVWDGDTLHGLNASGPAPRALSADALRASRSHGVPRARVDERLRPRRPRRLGHAARAVRAGRRSTRCSQPRSGSPRTGSRSRRWSRSCGAGPAPSSSAPRTPPSTSGRGCSPSGGEYPKRARSGAARGTRRRCAGWRRRALGTSTKARWRRASRSTRRRPEACSTVTTSRRSTAKWGGADFGPVPGPRGVGDPSERAGESRRCRRSASSRAPPCTPRPTRAPRAGTTRSRR